MAEVWSSRNMDGFYREVIKSFAEHSGNNEAIRGHFPETHGHELNHGQITLINRTSGNAFKIKYEVYP